jgi:glycogen debranching enzyme
MELATDFSDMFAVGKDTVPHGEVTWKADGEDLVAEASRGVTHWGVRIHLDGATATAPGLLTVDLTLPAGAEWCGTMQVFPSADHEECEPAFPRGEPLQDTAPATRLRDWADASPAIDLPDNLSSVVDRSIQDLGALRTKRAVMGVEVDVVAAGAPWFMTLFGRDSLITAWMALPIDQELALSTLHALAALQGREVNPVNEEEPGRILHEVREGASFPLSPGHSVYYGTADATPLFCMLVGELHRWGMPKERLAPLMPHVDRALAWILEYGDRDGDGFVEYQRANDTGLLNQGWKDIDDSISSADGRLPEGPIAMVEVQAYVYGAFVARAELARAFGDDPTEWESRAAQLRKRFHRAFWLPDRGYYAMALDGQKRPLDALGSNIGHVLWTGLAEPGAAMLVAERLLSPEMFSGWGIRTLATSMGRYSPVSYHNGSVWPHDTAICVAGLARYGYAEHAERVARAVFDAASAYGGRLPELFCGFDRAEFACPVAYPSSCSPQAWAAATPFLLLRAVLGFEPDVPAGKVYFNPPMESAELTDVAIRNLPIAGGPDLRYQPRRDPWPSVGRRGRARSALHLTFPRHRSHSCKEPYR